MTEKAKPTPEQFTTYQRLFDYFNGRLFNNELPAVILNFSRKANSCGFFAPHRWGKGSTTTHEISINPVYLATAPFLDVCQTLTHEMTHLWQLCHGEPSRTGYHNKEWADKMESIGLMPSSTGAPGGAKVGQNMNDYPLPGGAFEKAFQALSEEYRLPWHSREASLIPVTGATATTPAAAGSSEEPTPEPAKSKVKYTCPKCAANAWGKPELHIICGEYREDFQEKG